MALLSIIVHCIKINSLYTNNGLERKYREFSSEVELVEKYCIINLLELKLSYRLRLEQASKSYLDR